jgi:hypothetical protein
MKAESKTSTRHTGTAGLTAAVFSLLFVLHPSEFTLAQKQDIPSVGQPEEHFYGARGSGVKVAWSLDRDKVPLDGEVVATLTITNATNPTKITRPDLKKLPAFHSLFTVIDNTDPPPATDAREVKFTYRLRPRDEAVKEVPALDFYYYNPAAAEGKQFPLTRAKKVAITVLPPKPKLVPVVPLSEPDELFAITKGPELLTGEPFVPGKLVWILIGVLGPFLALGWYGAWRRMFPDAARLAKMRRSRAARRAMEAIRKSGRTPDPPATIANAVLVYLRTRFPLPVGTVTPTEIGAALTELGVPSSECAAASAFFTACDTARFSPSGDSAVSLAATAEALVTQLEAV